MPPKDLYRVLGVKKDASPQEIKKAYRKIARQTHPDVKPGDAEAEKRFKEATAAFEVLSETKKRKLYDEFGEDALRMGFDPEKARAYRAWQNAPGGGRGRVVEGVDIGDIGGFGFGSEGAGGFDLGDILGDLFGGAKKRGGRKQPFGAHTRAPIRRRGQDAEAEMRISLKEAVLGGEKHLGIHRQRACGTCNGEGLVEDAPCSACGGSGMQMGPARLKVKIPPGVGDGQRIRLAGQGQPGIGGALPGDLFVRVTIDPHQIIRRDGKDLYLDLPVTVKEAFQGASIEVPTFQGGLRVKVPPGSQSGRKLRLKGRGMPARKGEAGDLYLVLSIRLPTQPNDEGLEEAIEALEAKYSSSPRAGLAL